MKPRVYKGPTGWMVERPGYGFSPATTAGPHRTQTAALTSLRGQPGNAGSTAERTTTPAASPRGGGRIWPMEVR